MPRRVYLGHTHALLEMRVSDRVSHYDADDYAGLPRAAEHTYTVTLQGDGFELVTNDGGLPGIRCRRCLLVSYHPEDIAQRYCGFCRPERAKVT